MINLEVNQELIPQNERLSESLILAISEKVSLLAPHAPSGEMGLAFVHDEEIQRLNRMYRNKDAVTDVLSWSYFEEDPESETLGDIVISYDQAKRQSNDGDIELEVVDLIVHGMLHVLGYDHELPEDALLMFPLQDKIVAEIL